MKKIVALGGIAFVIMACSEKNPNIETSTENLVADYDTIAIDSFSAGATSVDIIRNIRMSSQKYQDSLKAAIQLQKEEEKIKLELQKEEKRKAEEEKKQKQLEKENTLTEVKPE